MIPSNSTQAFSQGSKTWSWQVMMRGIKVEGSIRKCGFPPNEASSTETTLNWPVLVPDSQ